jgi:hypothetical protein
MSMVAIWLPRHAVGRIKTKAGTVRPAKLCQCDLRAGDLKGLTGIQTDESIEVNAGGN